VEGWEELGFYMFGLGSLFGFGVAAMIALCFVVVEEAKQGIFGRNRNGGSS